MKRRQFVKLASAAAAVPLASGCGLTRIDPWHVLIRSPHIETMEQADAIVAKAKTGWTADGRIRVLYVSGTPYERGYQHGVLLRNEASDNLSYIYNTALEKFHFQELFYEVYERMRPYIPQRYIDEMHGLAHGARIPLHLVHHIHILPSIGEWGGRRKIRKVLKAMMRGELGTSCSNIGVRSQATKDGSIYAVRILDWGLHRISKLHEYPLITVGVPENGHAYCNIGWCGFIGAVSGMNEQGITLGEMGYGDPPFERLEGMPMPFLLRDVMEQAKNLPEVRKVISSAPPTASFGYLMTDGKTAEAELYVRDPKRFDVFPPEQDLYDERQDKRGNVRKEFFPARPGTVYGGHYEEVMAQILKDYNGQLTPELFMEKLIPKMVMKSNFQNVVYDPKRLQFWVNNARSRSISAKHEPYSKFEFGKQLREYRNSLRSI